ncbi:GNAT family N-acetyltransferase, partial [Vibrio sp. V05_P4A8T149]
SDIFNFDQGEVNEFDKKFQEKEKKYQHTQELFKMLIRSYLRNNN